MGHSRGYNLIAGTYCPEAAGADVLGWEFPGALGAPGPAFGAPSRELGAGGFRRGIGVHRLMTNSFFADIAGTFPVISQ